MLQVALGQREQITVFGDDYPTPDGTCIRDYIHVDDLGTAHVLALERLEPGKGLQLNLGTGRGHSVREVIEPAAASRATRFPPSSARAAPGDPPELVADSRWPSRRCSLEAAYTDIEPIVGTAWKWHSTHPCGYDDVAGAARRANRLLTIRAGRRWIHASLLSTIDGHQGIERTRRASRSCRSSRFRK